MAKAANPGQIIRMKSHFWKTRTKPTTAQIPETSTCSMSGNETCASRRFWTRSKTKSTFSKKKSKRRRKIMSLWKTTSKSNTTSTSSSTPRVGLTSPAQPTGRVRRGQARSARIANIANGALATVKISVDFGSKRPSRSVDFGAAAGRQTFDVQVPLRPTATEPQQQHFGLLEGRTLALDPVHGDRQPVAQSTGGQSARETQVVGFQVHRGNEPAHAQYFGPRHN